MIVNDECSNAVLNQYLIAELNDSDQALVERHLDHCVACREQLQYIAASPDFWQDARNTLAGASTIGWKPASHENDPDSTTSTATSTTISQWLNSFLGPSDDAAMLGRISDYEISGVLGFGSMGIVLKALDRSLGRCVAIKVLSPTFSNHGSPQKRFEREARATAGVIHQNVIDIHTISEWNGLPYFVMPFVEGESLQERIDRQGELTVEDVLQVGVQVAAALEAAHGEGLIHRDIKPANVLLEKDVDRLIVTDFGLARAIDDSSLTASGVIAGTPQYMSPEQAKGEAIDQRSDLFSLGSLLYACRAGRPPFRAETAFGVLQSIADQTPQSLCDRNKETPEWLSRIVDRLLAKNVDDRFQSATEVSDVMQKCLAHYREPQLYKLPSHLIGPTNATGQKWRTLKLIATSCIGLLMVAGLIKLGLPNRQATVPPKTEPIPQILVPSPKTQANNVTTAPADSKSTKSTESTEVKYRFSAEQTVPYLITMSAAYADRDAHLEGLVEVECNRAKSGHFDLLICCDLKVAETYHQQTENDGVTWNSHGTQWQRWQSTSGRIQADEHGVIRSQERAVELPYALGDVTEFVIQQLPDEFEQVTGSDNTIDSNRVKFSSSAWSDEESESTSNVTTIFHTSDGIIESVRGEFPAAKEIIEAVRSPMIRLELTRMSSKERAEWRQTIPENKSGKKPGNKPLSSTDEAACLADLASNDRTMYWLHRLGDYDAGDYSPDLVDAIVALTEHKNRSYRVLAQRIVDRIPDAQLNPFRITD